MNRQRFETLTETFGGDVARWPEAERETAAALMATEPAWVAGVLAEAVDLDAILDAAPAPRASAVLIDAIVAGAPAARRPPWLKWLLPAGMGAGLAAACAAGIVAGLQLAPASAFDAEPVITAVGDEDYALDLDEEA